MKNTKSNKTLMSFAGSAMNLSEIKKVNGGGRNCPARMPWQYGCPELL